MSSDLKSDSMKIIALLGTHGVPARHGAFEQTVAKLCEIAENDKLPVHIYVGCSEGSRALEYENSKVTRVYAIRPKGIGILLYDFLTSCKAYWGGARTFVYFGYEFSPLYFIFKLLGVYIIVNVDGIEWRRAKWGRIPKIYFKYCEFLSTKFANQLIFDAHGIARYFSIHHRAKGTKIFYGSDSIPKSETKSEHEKGSYYSVVMRMEPENNILEIVKGFSESSNEKQLLLIGPSTQFFELECMPFVDGNRIIYKGPIYERDKLNNLRRNSFGYIHGHSVGGTNPTLIEAVGLRNRIVAYNSIFNREVCGASALYFNNASDLTELLNNTKLLEPPELGPEYSWEYVGRKYFELCGV